MLGVWHPLASNPPSQDIWSSVQKTSHEAGHALPLLPYFNGQHESAAVGHPEESVGAGHEYSSDLHTGGQNPWQPSAPENWTWVL